MSFLVIVFTNPFIIYILAFFQAEYTHILIDPTITPFTKYF